MSTLEASEMSKNKSEANLFDHQSNQIKNDLPLANWFKISSIAMPSLAVIITAMAAYDWKLEAEATKKLQATLAEKSRELQLRLAAQDKALARELAEKQDKRERELEDKREERAARLEKYKLCLHDKTLPWCK